jgi:hypothetical protein
MDNYTIKTVIDVGNDTLKNTGFNIVNNVLMYQQTNICESRAGRLRNMLDMVKSPISFAAFSKYLALNGFNDLINSLVIRNKDHYSMISMGLTDTFSISIDDKIYSFSNCSITEEVVGKITSALDEISNTIDDNSDIIGNTKLIGDVVSLTENGNISDYVSFDNKLEEGSTPKSKEVTELNNRIYFTRNTISTELVEGFRQPIESIDNFFHFVKHVQVYELQRVVSSGDLIDMTILYNDNKVSGEYPFTTGKALVVPDKGGYNFVKIVDGLVASVTNDRIILRSTADNINEFIIKNCRLIKKKGT